MSNPIRNQKLRHYLEFKSLGIVDLYEIIEPIGIDGAQMAREQEPKRNARTVEYYGIEKIKFVSAQSIKKTNKQQVNPQGKSSYRLDMGLEWILEALKQDGFNAKVYYHQSVNGNFLPSFQLDFTEKKLTDFKTFVECKLVQNDNVAEIYRRFDDKVNLFSTKNYKNIDITPVDTINVLRKATPIRRENFWNDGGEVTFFDGDPSDPEQAITMFNFATFIEKDQLRNAFTPFEPLIRRGNYPENGSEFLYFKAVRKTNSLKIELDVEMGYFVAQGSSSGSGFVRLRIKKGMDFATAENILLYDDVWDSSTTKGVSVKQKFTHTFPLVNVGEQIWIYWIEGANLDCSVETRLKKMTLNINATQTSLNTIVPSIRYIDFLKQPLKTINALPIDAPLFDVGGTHYNQVVYNKRLISNKKDYFYITPKDALESVFEVNCDYEPNNDYCYIGHVDDFYKDVEIAVVHELPSNESTIEYNDKSMVNNIKIGYDNYAKDRDVLGSEDLIHGESEWNVPNEAGSNKFERKFKQIRDSVEIQDIFDLEFKKPTVVTDSDDKFILQDIVTLATGSFFEETFTLLLQSSGTTRKLLNYSLDGGEDEDLGINWETIGLTVGQTVIVNDLENWVVSQITSNIITFTAPTVFIIDNFQGDVTIKIKFFYQGVLYTTRTNEGFDLINGINNNFGNLAYSPRRNMKYFEKDYALMLADNKIGVINNVQYKNNGLVETKLITESESIIENARSMLLLGTLGHEGQLRRPLVDNAVLIVINELPFDLHTLHPLLVAVGGAILLFEVIIRDGAIKLLEIACTTDPKVILNCFGAGFDPEQVLALTLRESVLIHENLPETWVQNKPKAL